MVHCDKVDGVFSSLCCSLRVGIAQRIQSYEVLFVDSAWSVLIEAGIRTANNVRRSATSGINQLGDVVALSNWKGLPEEPRRVHAECFDQSHALFQVNCSRITALAEISSREPKRLLGPIDDSAIFAFVMKEPENLFRPLLRCAHFVPLRPEVYCDNQNCGSVHQRSYPISLIGGSLCIVLSKGGHMTAIVALTDGTKLCIAGDSAGVMATGEIQLSETPKVFVREGYAMGFTTSFRMGQLLKYEVSLPPYPGAGSDLEEFMVRTFVPAIRTTFADHGFSKSLTRGKRAETMHYEEQGQQTGGRFIVGVRGTLFVIEEDFHVAKPRTPYVAIGSGATVAHGALFALHTQVPLRVCAETALKASAFHTSGVRPPFTVLEV